MVALICVLSEVFVFNLEFWSSRGYQPITVEENDVTVGVGLQRVQDPHDPHAIVYKVIDLNTATIGYPQINQHVDNVYVPVTDVTTEAEVFSDPSHPNLETENRTMHDRRLDLRFEANDAGHRRTLKMPQVSVQGHVSQSQWIRLHLAGATTRFTIRVMSPVGATIHLGSLPVLNSPRPFIINPVRVSIYALMLLLTIVIPRIRRDWRVQAAGNTYLAYWVIAVFLGVAFTAGVTLATRPWQSLAMSSWAPDYEYQWMAQSLIKGRPTIDYPVAPALRDLTNPYDDKHRILTLRALGQSYLFDFAFFDNKYYSYFGVLPCVLFFVPYRLATGTNLAPWTVTLALTVIVAALAANMVRLAFRRWMPYAPLPLQAMAGFAGACAVQPSMALSFQSNTYAIPIASALALALGAVCLWISASMLPAASRAYWPMIIVGGVCSGLVIGCRPPMCAVIFLAPFILYPSIVERGGDRWFTLARSWIVNALAVGLPALAATLPFLWWNWIRFSGPFDFGADYQLTGTDVRATVEAGGAAKLPYMVWQGLLAPASSQDSFPFFKMVADNMDFGGWYQGYYGVEPRAGGMMFWVPLAWTSLALLSRRVRRAASLRIQVLICALMVLGVGMLGTEVVVAALAMRYLSDMAYMFVLAGVLGLAAWSAGESPAGADEDVGAGASNVAFRAGFALSVITVLLAVVATFQAGRVMELSYSNPQLFTMTEYAFAIFR